MHLRFFPAFFDHPARMRFAFQEEDERIELLLRQHFITNIPWIFLTLVAIFIPFLVGRVTPFLEINLQIPPRLELPILILWYMLVFAYALEKFLYWYFNIYIVTNKHIVDISFHNILHRENTEARLDDIQSVKAGLRGIFGSLFNFGDLIAETAAEKQRIQFLSIPKPDFVKDRVQDLQELEEGNDVT